MIPSRCHNAHLFREEDPLSLTPGIRLDYENRLAGALGAEFLPGNAVPGRGRGWYRRATVFYSNTPPSPPTPTSAPHERRRG